MWNRIAAILIVITTASLLVAPMDAEAKRGKRGWR